MRRLAQYARVTRNAYPYVYLSILGIYPNYSISCYSEMVYYSSPKMNIELYMNAQSPGHTILRTGQIVRLNPTVCEREKMIIFRRPRAHSILPSVEVYVYFSGNGYGENAYGYNITETKRCNRLFEQSLVT